jgi:hypothetical protein
MGKELYCLNYSKNLQRSFFFACHHKNGIMKRHTILLLLLLMGFVTIAQQKNAIELSLLTRYDQQADYNTFKIGGDNYQVLRLYGTSYGINGLFRRNMGKHWSVYAGAGFYQMGIDKVKRNLPTTTLPTLANRQIKYADESRLLYTTGRYHYNNLAVTLGVSREFELRKNIRLDMSAELVGYKNFSQQYNLLDGKKHLTTHNSRFAFGANFNPGIIKDFKRFYLRPSLIIPVYQHLKGDRMFYEPAEMNIPKWFNGIGVAVRIGKWI